MKREKLCKCSEYVANITLDEFSWKYFKHAANHTMEENLWECSKYVADHIFGSIEMMFHNAKDIQVIYSYLLCKPFIPLLCRIG